ncbi:TetR/AcrR family transcriptional regulator [Phosphitispora sp. TUW77]|uniref:TetR/AcrR family transcriptional regulator n=1 Tax=Phosphitispora sp. TUW77 TaxID=3152361 RepID=UPI003AB4573A
MRELNSIQEKILDRTLFVIGLKGSYDVSVRDITNAAGVNVNAIHYYFGNKEALFDRMEEFFIENYLSIHSVLEDRDINDEQKLMHWANEIMEYTLQYPGIQIILHNNMSGKGRNGKMAKFLIEQSNEFHHRINELFSRLFNVQSDQLMLMRIIFDSALLYPASFGTRPNCDFTKIRDKSFRLSYIKYIIQLLKQGKKHNEIIQFYSEQGAYTP